jgi:type II secretory pathway pseudopilin PulG
MSPSNHHHRRRAHTLIELVAAMVCSVVLLGGLASVMLVARQVAYTPSAAARRTQAADVVNRLSDELRYATLILQQSSWILEFLVTDRNADGTAEKIRYEWSGTVGEPLYKTINGGTPTAVIKSINEFQINCVLKPKLTAYTATTDSAEAVLQSNATVQAGPFSSISATSYSSQQINPSAFPSIPANAISWTATKVDFYGLRSGPLDGNLSVQLRPTGDPNDGPTSHAQGLVIVAESALTSGLDWNTATFSSPARDLALHRRYAIVWTGSGVGISAQLRVNDSVSSGVLESSDAGASWQFMKTPWQSVDRQMFYRLYGTYTTPGTTYNVTRNFVSHVRLALRAGEKTHSRIDASIPLANLPELLSAYWRADFDANPTTTNANGDAIADWGVASGSFDATKLIGGIWYAASALETRPANDFLYVTTVDVRCRNTSVGGNGAVLRINADRQGGQYAPLLVYLQLQADGTQTLSLHAKSSDAATSRLFSRSGLPSGFVRYQLTIIPQSNVVNLAINGEDQGTFSYTTYAPASATDRFLALYADTSSAEFDYCEVRVGTN